MVACGFIPTARDVPGFGTILERQKDSKTQGSRLKAQGCGSGIGGLAFWDFDF